MKKIGIFILLIFIGSCIDRIEVDTSSEPDRIVVDGFITSQEGKHLVKILKTNIFSNLPNERVQGAVVEIIDSEDEVTTLVEEMPGFYYTRSNFKAREGVGYIIRIEVYGKVIESSELQLPGFTPIESAEYVPDTRTFQRRIDNELVDLPGVVINTHLNEIDGNERFFLWDVKDTFIYDAPLARSDDVRRCWVTSITPLKDIVIHHDLEGNYDQEITFITASREMTVDYSLNVIQYNISEEAYDYWNKLKKQRENVGSIFEAPPYSISGNLFNTQDNKDLILGYFDVRHVSESRVSWSLEDLPFNLDLVPLCQVGFFRLPAECFSCLSYFSGTVTNVQPDWWGK